MAGRGAVTIPHLLVSADDAGNWIEEGAPSPVRGLSFTTGQILEPRKLVVNAAFTREMAEHSSIESVVRRVLGQAVGLARTDDA
jgi:hypothetical protein